MKHFKAAVILFGSLFFASCSNDILYDHASLPPVPPLRMWGSEAGEDSLLLSWSDVNAGVSEYVIQKSSGFSSIDYSTTFSDIARVPASARSIGIAFVPEANSGSAQYTVRALRNGVMSKRNPIVNTSVSRNIFLNKDHDMAFTAQPNNSVAVSGNGKFIAVTNNDGTIKLWEVIDYSFGNQPVRTISLGSVQATSAKFSPSMVYLATGASDGSVKLWNLSDGSLLSTLNGHTGGVYALDFTPDSKYLVSGSYDGTAAVWDVQSRTKLYSTSKTAQYVTSLAVHPDGSVFAIGNSDGKIRSFTLSTGAEAPVISHGTGWVYALGYHPNGTLLAGGGSDNIIKIWNTSDGSTAKTLSAHTGWVTGVTFSPTGKSLFSVSKDKSVKMWNVSEGTVVKSVTTSYEQSGVAVSPFGKNIYTSNSASIQYWRYSTLNISGF